MADKCDLCLLGLIFLSSLLTGSSEDDYSHVFISSGEDVRLPCNNALTDCTSTTWLYNRYKHLSAVELIAGGKKKKNIERHERLSLGSDCSLNIRNIRKDDYGLYTCRQYVNKELQGTDAYVFLHVLQVSSSSSSSSSQTEISTDSVTLFCQLYSYSYTADSCEDWMRFERIDLFWVNQAGVKLNRSDSRYQILLSSDHCIISLNTTLLNEDLNRDWRCEVTHRDQVKSSVTYTVKSSAQADPVTAETSTQGVESTTATNSLNKVILVVIAALFAVFLLAVILWVIHKKRAGVRRSIDDSEEQTDDVIYTDITVYRKNEAKKNKVCCDDKVIYTSIRGTKVNAQDNCSQL